MDVRALFRNDFGGTAEKGSGAAFETFDDRDARATFGENDAPRKDCRSRGRGIADDDRVVAGMVGSNVHEDAALREGRCKRAELRGGDAGRSEGAREKLGRFARGGREVANEDCRIVIFNAHVCGAQIDRAGLGRNRFEVDAPEAPRLFTTAA